jgi:hypothetical protein
MGALYHGVRAVNQIASLHTEHHLARYGHRFRALPNAFKTIKL